MPDGAANSHVRQGRCPVGIVYTPCSALAGTAFSVADISLYAYTHMAHQGGYDLAAFPAIGRWLERIASRPGHVPIDAE